MVHIEREWIQMGNVHRDGQCALRWFERTRAQWKIEGLVYSQGRSDRKGIAQGLVDGAEEDSVNSDRL